MRLRQAHGAGPCAVDQLRQVGALQFVGAVQVQRVVGAVAEARIHAERQVGGAEELLQHEVDDVGQALAAVFRIGGHSRPAAFDELGVGFREAGGGADHAVLVVAAFLVAGAVERLEHVFRQLGAFLQHGLDQVGRVVLVAGQFGKLGDGEDFVEHETNIVQRRLVGRHDGNLSLSSAASVPERLAGGEHVFDPGEGGAGCGPAS